MTEWISDSGKNLPPEVQERIALLDAEQDALREVETQILRFGIDRDTQKYAREAFYAVSDIMQKLWAEREALQGDYAWTVQE